MRSSLVWILFQYKRSLLHAILFLHRIGLCSHNKVRAKFAFSKFCYISRRYPFVSCYANEPPFLKGFDLYLAKIEAPELSNIIILKYVYCFSLQVPIIYWQKKRTCHLSQLGNLQQRNLKQ